MQYEVCDLFQKCYGQEAYSAVSMFLKLDEIDRSKVIERIQTLLESEKIFYQKNHQTHRQHCVCGFQKVTVGNW